jgi:hypothetical protein
MRAHQHAALFTDFVRERMGPEYDSVKNLAYSKPEKMTVESYQQRKHALFVAANAWDIDVSDIKPKIKDDLEVAK